MISPAAGALAMAATVWHPAADPDLRLLGQKLESLAAEGAPVFAVVPWLCGTRNVAPGEHYDLMTSGSGEVMRDLVAPEPWPANLPQGEHYCASEYGEVKLPLVCTNAGWTWGPMPPGFVFPEVFIPEKSGEFLPELFGSGVLLSGPLGSSEESVSGATGTQGGGVSNTQQVPEPPGWPMVGLATTLLMFLLRRRIRR